VTTCSRFAVLVLASLALASTACQLPVFFPEVLVNTSDPDHQLSNDVAMGDDGEFIVVWTEFAGDGEVLGRQYDRPSTPLGGPFPLNADTTIDQEEASVAKDAEGRFVAVWVQEDMATVRGRRFEADGTPLGGSFQVNTSTTHNNFRPHVASDPSGNFVVAWTSTSVSGTEAMARRFDSNGVPLGDEFQVNVFSDGPHQVGGAAMSPAGFVVSWAGEGEGTTNGIFARLFDAAGNPLTDDLPVTGALETYLPPPDVAMNAKGDFVVVWHDGDEPTLAVSGRRWSFAGTPSSDAFAISSSTLDARDPRVSSDSSGNFIVSWIGTFDPPEVSGEPSAAAGLPTPVVTVRLYDIGGFAVSSPFVVNDYTSDLKFRARVSLVDDGSFVLAWNSSAGKGANDVMARKTGVRAAPSISVDVPLTIGSSPAGGGGGSAFNGVFEPGETVIPFTAWTNDTAADVNSVSGSAPLFTGPPGADYTLNDPTALYDTVPAGQTKSCILDCYSVTVSDPVARPVQHWDALLQETLNLSLPHTWVLHIGESFPDVPTDHQFYRFIENLFHNQVTGGCAGGDYCPGNAVTRAQMAVFLLKGKFGAAHIPPPCTGTVFADVPCTGDPFDPWIEELAGLAITGGCGPDIYCPGNPVTRQQMAVFLLKAFEGSAYLPPACAGIFNDVPCTPGTGFSDWIEELFNRGITGGCSVTPPLYCPTNPNNRGQMAVFLVKTFGLVLYGG
jgi:S-layer homology domain